MTDFQKELLEITYRALMMFAKGLKRMLEKYKT